MTTLLSLLVGMIVGYWDPPFLRNLQRVIPTVTNCLLLMLLFWTSLTFGLDPAVSSSLGRIGRDAGISAALTLLFSVGSATLWHGAFSRVRRQNRSGQSAIPVDSHGETSVGKPISLLVVVLVVAGWGFGTLLCGRYGPWGLPGYTSRLSDYSLLGLLLVIGYTLGVERVWHMLSEYGWSSVTLPVVVAIASLLGAALVTPLTGTPLSRNLAAGAGFGWYSLAGAMALDAGGPELGAYVFLANVLREVITLVIVPLLAGRVPAAAAAAMGGATSMDSTLPVVARSFGTEGAMWGLVVGTTLSALCPLAMNLVLAL